MVGNDNAWDRLASDIENTVDDACKRFKGLPAEAIEARPNPGDWSVKEILGHLIDSASNNHQRFVRLLFFFQFKSGDDFAMNFVRPVGQTQRS